MKTVLIIGKNGQVTSYLQATLGGNYDVVAAGRDVLDLSKVNNIQAVLERLKPALIINPAAFTAVDLAEQESHLAFTINRDAVKEIAAYSKLNNTPLIHFSTDYVFAGDADQAYVESDEPAPTGVYGRSKLEGEQAIIEAGAPAIILRTSWVYSNHGKNFYKTMLMLSESRDELSVVDDQIGAPTYAGSIADATKVLVEKILEQGKILESQVGVYHFTCKGQTSWCEFAKALFIENGVTKIKVNGIPSSDYPTPARRPAFSVLDGGKLHRTFGVTLPDWQSALKQCAADTASNTHAD